MQAKRSVCFGFVFAWLGLAAAEAVRAELAKSSDSSLMHS